MAPPARYSVAGRPRLADTTIVGYVQRVRACGVHLRDGGADLRLDDPWGNLIRVSPA